MKDIAISTAYRVRAAFQFMPVLRRGESAPENQILRLEEEGAGSESGIELNIAADQEKNAIFGGYEVRYGRGRLLFFALKAGTEELTGHLALMGGKRPVCILSPERKYKVTCKYTKPGEPFLAAEMKIDSFGGSGDSSCLCLDGPVIRLSGREIKVTDTGDSAAELEKERTARMTAEAELAAMRKNYDDLEKEVDSMRQIIDGLEKEQKEEIREKIEKAAAEKTAALETEKEKLEKEKAEMKAALEGTIDRRLRDYIRQLFEEGKLYTANLQKNLNEAGEEEKNLRKKQDELKAKEDILADLRREAAECETKKAEYEAEIARLAEEKEKLRQSGEALEEISAADAEELRALKEELTRRYQLDKETLELLDSDPALRAAGASETMEEIRKQLEVLEKQIGFIIRVREKINRDLTDSITSYGGGVVPIETETGGYHG